MPSGSGVTVAEMVEALALFDEPMLNSRYHSLLARRALDHDELARLPALATRSARLAREGSVKWARKEGALSESDFLVWAEHAVLDSFLVLAENQLRILAQISRFAPTAETRKPFDEMVELHREIAKTLRTALKSQPRHGHADPEYTRNVQEGRPEGDLRGQLEAALDTAEQAGNGIREIVLSPVALRRLRDQGCFAQGGSTIRGHRVAVDLGWDAPAFVIETWDRVPLDEILPGSEPAGNGPEDG